MTIKTKHQLDYEKYPITSACATLIQHISLVPIAFTLIGYHLIEKKEKEAAGVAGVAGVAVVLAGRVLNMLLCSTAVAAGFAMLYKANKINFSNAIGLSFAFPLLWITSSFIAHLSFGAPKNESSCVAELENDMKNFTYFNPIFAVFLPITILSDICCVNVVSNKLEK